MKKENARSYRHLLILYLNFTCQKANLIIILIAMILNFLFLFLFSSPWLEEEAYLLSYNSVHKVYFEQGIFMLQLLNSIIIAAIVITIIINSTGFDTLFISFTPRHMICLMKILSVLVIITIIVLCEGIILFLIPVLQYQNYKFLLSDLIIVLYLFIVMIFEGLFSIMITTLIHNIFIPFLVLFISVIIRLICNNYARINKIVSQFLPIIDVNDHFECTGAIVSFILVILFTITFICTYYIKDIK